MDTSIVSGPVMSLIGITTVFVVLVCLVSVVSLMRRFFGDEKTSVPAAQSATPDRQARAHAPSEEPSDTQPEPDLLKLALATYAYHRSRQATAKPPVQTTEWSSAGRVRQIASFRR